MSEVIKIGSRKSKLALTQTNLMIDAVKAIYPELSFEIVPMQTLGDKILDKPLVEFGGKGVFVSEFESALLEETIDFAVHSAKDMPMKLADGLCIVGIPKREDPRDVLVTVKNKKFESNAPMKIGTSSLRRQIQISENRNVICESLRGNVTTRLDKLRNGQYDGIILAAAGLKRLGLHEESDLSYEYLSVDTFIPSGGQGILAVEGRVNDTRNQYLACINDEAAKMALYTERAVLEELQAGCNMPIGVYSEELGEDFTISLFIQKDGTNHWLKKSGKKEECFALAQDLIEELP